MLKVNHIFLCASIVCGLASCDAGGRADGRTYDFGALSEEFADPSVEFKTAPLYVLNNAVTRDQIDRTMTDLKEKGFGGIFFHPRPGLITEYLSDEWYDLFGYALEKGGELGMNVWIYDENSYPSGFAGGHVPAEMPESYNQGSGLLLEKYDRLPDRLDEFVVCLRETDGGFVDITATAEAERGKDGNYYLFKKAYEHRGAWFGGWSYVDLLHAGVTEKFIDVTMPGYKRVAGDKWGKSMPGWFTDEPNIRPPGGSVRWTPDLFEVFRRTWNYGLETALPSLFEEVGDWRTVRHNYQQTLLAMFIDRWAKPGFEYCEQNGLLFTGHYWEHGWPDVADGGDNMAMYAWHQMPAIDMLFNQFNEESPYAQFGNVRAVKELSSVANQMGYRRTLSETYGGGGWEETFRDFKRLGDWEYALGVNFMNQHLAHLSTAGARKYDYPPEFNDHSPWWPWYRDLNMHYARLSMALSSGEQINDILVLEPTTSLWLYYAYGNSNTKLREIGQAFQTFVTTLEKAQVEYDLGSENIIKDHGRVENGRFVVNRRSYSTVAIPPMMENIDSPTRELLTRFIDGGGKVVAFSTPSFVDGKLDSGMEDCFTGKPNVKLTEELTAAVIDEEFRSDDLTFQAARGGNLYHHRREMNDGEVLFLVNSSLDEAATGSVTLRGKDAVELDTFTGEMRDYPETTAGKTVIVEYDLPPAGSLLLYVFPNKRSGFAVPRPAMRYTPLDASSPLDAKPDGDNVLTLDFCDLELSGETFRDLHVTNASDRAFRHNGFEGGNPWNSSVQYRDNIVCRDTLTSGGFRATYRFTVDGDFDMERVRIAVERPSLYTVSLNGREISPEPGTWFFDRETGVFAAGGAIKPGVNELTLLASPMSIHAELEAVYVLGDFAVRPVEKGFAIAPPVAAPFTTGSWKAQGRPFYNGAVTYTRTFDVAELADAYRVTLGEWTGTVAAVSVNGEQAGIIGFEPYSVDVSKFIRPGFNTIEVKIVGSNKNLLGPFHNRPSPGFVSPGHFRYGGAMPAGTEYQQLDYGLMGDFALEEGGVVD